MGKLIISAFANAAARLALQWGRPLPLPFADSLGSPNDPSAAASNQRGKIIKRKKRVL
jgi:hypothetical protein